MNKSRSSSSLLSNLSRNLPQHLIAFVALVAWPLACSSDSNDADLSSRKTETRYLAIGDSLTYGDNLYIPPTAEARPDLSAFISYANFIAEEKFAGAYINTACPGEASGSFLDQSAPDHGCRHPYRSQTKLKHQYAGSQVDAMIQIIKNSPKLELITVTLGGNDYFITLKECQAKSAGDLLAVKTCLDQSLPATVGKLLQNLRKIVEIARESGFKGKFVILNYSALDYQDAASVASAKGSNAALQQFFANDNILIADVFTGFETAVKAFNNDICASGIMHKNPKKDPPAHDRCDVHPSPLGARIVADQVLSVLK